MVRHAQNLITSKSFEFALYFLLVVSYSAQIPCMPSLVVFPSTYCRLVISFRLCLNQGFGEGKGNRNEKGR